MEQEPTEKHSIVCVGSSTESNNQGNSIFHKALRDSVCIKR